VLDMGLVVTEVSTLVGSIFVRKAPKIINSPL
jgi:hypothetical protein